MTRRKTVCQHCGHFTPVYDDPRDRPAATLNLNGLHIMVGGVPIWVSPAILRSWVAVDPDNPTADESNFVVKVLGRMQAMADELQREAAG